MVLLQGLQQREIEKINHAAGLDVGRIGFVADAGGPTRRSGLIRGDWSGLQRSAGCGPVARRGRGRRGNRLGCCRGGWGNGELEIGDEYGNGLRTRVQSRSGDAGSGFWRRGLLRSGLLSPGGNAKR